MFNVLAQTTIISRIENENGESVYVAPRKTSASSKQFCILVQRNDNGWKPVNKLDSSVDRFSFQSNYAFLNSTSQVNGSTGGEVKLSGLSFDKDSNSYLAGEELEMKEDGQVVLHSKTLQFPSDHKPSREDYTDILEYHYDDSEWNV